jgi:hypothetical protein
MSSDNSYFLNSATQNLPNTPTQTSSSQSQSSQSGLYNGCTSISFMDELIKEYLLFRGFNATIKAFEHDLKQDKDRSFRADKITDQLFAYIHAYDLNGLLDYWTYLDHKYFSKISLKLSAYSSAALSRKYELFLLRYYLINAIQNAKTDKAIELFENYASKLQSQSEWKEWYCLPFLKNPEENLIFSVYFNKNWKDAFIVSLQNFLNIVFQSVNFPRLLNYDEDAFWNKQIYQKSQSANNVYFGLLKRLNRKIYL